MLLSYFCSQWYDDKRPVCHYQDVRTYNWPSKVLKNAYRAITDGILDDITMMRYLNRYPSWGLTVTTPERMPISFISALKMPVEMPVRGPVRPSWGLCELPEDFLHVWLHGCLMELFWFRFGWLFSGSWADVIDVVGCDRTRCRAGVL